MKDYLVLIRGGDARMAVLNEQERHEHMEKWQSYMGELASNGNLAGGLPLAMDARLLSNQGVTNDPVKSDAGEAIGGYLIFKANNYDHAVELGKGCPVFEHDGSLEIREAMEM